MSLYSHITYISLVIVLLLALLISMCISFRLSQISLRQSRWVIYLLPLSLVCICMPFSWIPSAHVAGLIIGWSVILKLPIWIGLIAFCLTSMSISLGIAWLLTCIFMYSLNFFKISN